MAEARDETMQGVLWYSALVLYSMLVLPRMLSTGMFLDGVVYASIARNMAEGYGSLWAPAYTATVYPVFYEHPPLGFWLQAWAYRVGGDVVAVEAFWGCGMGLLLLLELAGIWRCLQPSDTPLTGAWFPAMLWVLTPMTSWAVAQNMLEVPLTVCSLGAVWLCLLGLQHPRPGVRAGCSIGAGLMLLGGLGIKGPVALFPLAVPVLVRGYAGISRRRALGMTGGMLLTCVLVGSLLCLMQPAAWEFAKHYGQQQLWASVAGRRETSGSRWDVLRALSREIVVPLVLGGGLAVLRLRRPRTRRTSGQRRLGWAYLGIALAASLPLLLSVKQRRWYVFPSLPFYALALAALWQPAALRLERYLQAQPLYRQRLRAGCVLGLVLALGAMGLERHALRRDVTLYQDFAQPAVTLPARAMLSVYPAHLAAHWTLIAHLQRHFKASVTSVIGAPYLVTTHDTVLPEGIAAQYAPLLLPHARTYRLLRHRTAAPPAAGDGRQTP